MRKSDSEIQRGIKAMNERLSNFEPGELADVDGRMAYAAFRDALLWVLGEAPPNVEQAVLNEIRVTQPESN